MSNGTQIETEKYGSARFELVNPTTLKPHPRNPPQRTNPKAESYKELRRAIEVTGGVVAPLHISSDGVVEDGNTRRAISLELNLVNVPVIRYKSDHATLEAQGLYDELNRTGKGFKPKDQFVYALLGGEVADTGISNLAAFTKELLTSSEFEVLMKSKPTPTLIKLGKSLAAYCLPRGDLLTEPATRAFIRRAVMWLIRNRQQRPVIVYMQLKRSHGRLKSAIDNNRPAPALRGLNG